MKTAIVTGGTSGLGLAAAQTLAEKGLRVYALSRHGAPVPGVTSLACDITDADAVERTVAAIEAEAERIDLVVNNAGFGISGAVECTTPEEARRLFDVDFFGVVNVNHAVLPRMRRAGGGRIVHVSSVAAPIAIPFQAYYSATKAAVNDYTMALANELRPFGITVCAVQPGDIRTGFTAAREKTQAGDEIYGGRISRSVKRMEHDEQTGMDPAAAGRFICRVAQSQSRHPLYTIGASYKFFVFLTKILPAQLLNWMIGLLYAK